MAERPVGPLVDTQAAARPGPVVLDGRFCRIEKLTLDHTEALWAAARGDGTLWDYMGYGPFADAAAFAAWMADRVRAEDPFAYAVIDTERGSATGSVTLMEVRPAARVIEMGNIVYTPLLQRTAAATETQYLLARYVFEDLGYRRYEWKCNALNAPSMRAATRLGFTYEGTFRQHMIVKGRNRDTAWYSMLDGEWPALKAAYERWLEPGNFDAAGRQIASLESFRS